MSSHHIPMFGRLMSIRDIRRVWAAVSTDPQASVRELASQVDMTYGDVARALTILRDAGYVEKIPRTARARRIVVPFVEVPR